MLRAAPLMRSRLAVPAVRRRMMSTEVAKSTSSGPIVMPTNESSAAWALATYPLHLAANNVGSGLAAARWGVCVVIGLYLMIRPNEWKKVRPPPPPPLFSQAAFFLNRAGILWLLGPFAMSLRGLTAPLPARTGRLLHAQLPPRAVGEQGQQGDIQGRIRRARQKLCPFLRDDGCPSAWGLPWASTASAWVSSSWPETNRLCLLVGCSGYSRCGRAYIRPCLYWTSCFFTSFLRAASVDGRTGPGRLAQRLRAQRQGE